MNDLKDFEKNIAQITKEQWQQLFKLIPIIARTKNFGKWSPIKKQKKVTLLSLICSRQR